MIFITESEKPITLQKMHGFFLPRIKMYYWITGILASPIQSSLLEYTDKVSLVMILFVSFGDFHFGV